MEKRTKLPDAWTHSKDYAARYQTPKQIAEIIEHLELDKSSNLLDIGCGNGAFAITAAQQFPQCQVLAADPLESAVAECRKRLSQAKLKNLSVQQAQAEDLPYRDDCIDRLLMRNIIHHLANLDIALREACRVLVPQGLIVIEAPCNLGEQELGRLLSKVYLLMDDSHKRIYYHPKSVSSLLNGHNVAVRSVITWKCLSQVSNQAAALINRHPMGNQLRLHNKVSDQSLIALNFMRIVGQKVGERGALSCDAPVPHPSSLNPSRKR